MPTSMPPTNGDQRGFTLIELLVVLSVIGLLAAIAMPTLARNPSALQRSRLMAELETSLQQAAEGARDTNQPVTVVLPARKGLAFAPLISSSTSPVFYPDGSSNGGTISDNGQPLLSISWLDGRVANASR